MRKEIKESVGQTGLQVDRKTSTIQNVKVLGFISANHRRYTPEAVAQAAPMYENIKVNIDHPESASNDVRSLKDRFGKLTDIKMSDSGLWGNLIFNPNHPMAEAVLWWAENQPDCLGLSHMAIGQGDDDEDGVFVVSKILDVRSVDLVSDPATVNGLFEAKGKKCMDDAVMSNDEEAAVPDAPADDYETHLGHMVAAILKDDGMDVAAKRKKIMKALKLMDDGEPEASDDNMDEDDDGGDDPGMEESVRHLANSTDKYVKVLVKSFESVQLENKARKLCDASKVAATDVFVESLVRAGEKGMRALIEDRKAVVNKPKSSARVRETVSVEQFAEAIKKGK